MSTHYDHDRNFKNLMAERAFYEPFIKAYLPQELLGRVDWAATELHKMSGTHTEQNSQKTFEADVIYLTKIDGEVNFFWFHVEHQSTPDKTMVLRIIHYQTAELLAYTKQNPNQKLPSIITFIYHQGEKPWPYSLSLADLFAEPELAMRYFGKPILIDLPATPDEVLKTHQSIWPIEMILKRVRRKDFKKGLSFMLSALQTVDSRARRTVLQYIIDVADVSAKELIEVAKGCLPQDVEAIMTPREQWLAEGMHQGMQEGIHQGMQQGIHQGMQQGIHQGGRMIAQNMLRDGLPEATISKYTGLELEQVIALKKNTLH